MKKLLLIGPTMSEDIRSIGGTTILMDIFERELRNYNYEYEIIPTNKFSNDFVNFIFVIFRLIIVIHRCDVVIANAAKNFLYFLSPFLLCISKIFGKKYILRKFGGNLDRQLLSSGYIKSKLAYLSLRYSDLIFVETNLIKEYLSSEVKTKVALFPNNRYPPKFLSESKDRKLKYVFISQVKKEKGVEIIEYANRKLNNPINIFGPILDHELVLGENYKGVLNPKDVSSVLSKSRVLILPTYWEGEGHPGVIIEAFSLGIPVISTDFRAIPEIIDKGLNGILIEPKNEQALVSAILRFEKDFNYEKASASALEKFRTTFESRTIHRRILKIIEEL